LGLIGGHCRGGHVLYTYISPDPHHVPDTDAMRRRAALRNITLVSVAMKRSPLVARSRSPFLAS
jgi:hypothetical protein